MPLLGVKSSSITSSFSSILEYEPSRYLLFFTTAVPYKCYWCRRDVSPVIISDWIKPLRKSEFLVNWSYRDSDYTYLTIYNNILEMMTRYEKRCLQYEQRSKTQLASFRAVLHGRRHREDQKDHGGEIHPGRYRALPALNT